MMAEHDPLEELDYYTLLGVEPGASSDQIRRAFHQFAAKYHPDKFLAGGAEGRKVERAAQIYRRGAEAYKVLTNPRQRRLYDGQLATGKLRFDALAEPPRDGSADAKWPIRVKSPLARPFATKAEQAFKAGEWGNAKMNLKLALSKDAGNEQIQRLLAEVESKLAG
jgi:curved DNA-binding protein CbpA